MQFGKDSAAGRKVYVGHVGHRLRLQELELLQQLVMPKPLGLCIPQSARMSGKNPKFGGRLRPILRAACFL